MRLAYIRIYIPFANIWAAEISSSHKKNFICQIQTIPNYKLNPLFYDRQMEKSVKAELVEKYHYSKKRAAKISRDITRFHEMELKDNQDENMFFWDDDCVFIFQNGFIEGIQFLKHIAGESAGYGYDYTCGIFTDIGMKAPVLLVGTKEANKIANKVSWQNAKDILEDVLPKVEIETDWNDEDLPFS